VDGVICAIGTFGVVVGVGKLPSMNLPLISSKSPIEDLVQCC